MGCVRCMRTLALAGSRLSEKRAVYGLGFRGDLKESRDVRDCKGLGGPYEGF